MRLVVRAFCAVLLVVAAAVFLALPSPVTSAIALAASLYIVKGTNSAFNQIPDEQYPGFADDYLALVGVPNPSGPGNPPVLVDYPAAFFPITPPDFIFAPTYDESVAAGVASLASSRPVTSTSAGDVVWGYSQGAAVVSQYKKDYNAAYPGSGATPPVPPRWVLVANPNRPNGGILERGVALGTIPFLGVTFNGATPTNTEGVPDGTITTYDVARQYDVIADAPTNPLDVPAVVNALFGFYYLHGKYPDADLSTAIDQGTFGDTHYYLIPTPVLPVLMPLTSVPGIGPIAADMLDPALRVIVEAGYDRTTSPGQPTPFNVFYFPDPAAVSSNLLVAVPTGLDNGLEDAGAGRPAGTTRETNPFGVGGAPADEQLSALISDTKRADSPAPLLSRTPQPEQGARGPIGGSPSLPRAKDVASPDGVLRQIGGIAHAVTSAATHAAPSAAGGATGSANTGGTG